MPIDLPNLDDVDYDDLVNQAIASIPALYPVWTNHNASDPGITLIELFAWLTDMVVYRTNRIPPENYRVFLRILNGSLLPNAIAERVKKHSVDALPAPRSDYELPLPEAIAATVRQLTAMYRAVTPPDYESLTTGAFARLEEERRPDEPIRRVECLGERDVTSATPTVGAPGHVSLLIASETDPDDPFTPPSTDLLSGLAAFFEPRRLITTVLHVAGPAFVDVAIGATLYLEGDASPGDVQMRATEALMAHFHPWTGGPERTGWPFGRWVYASEISVVLGGLPGVDGVEGVTISATGADGDRSRTDSGAEDPSAIVAVEIEPHELPKVEAAGISFDIKTMRGVAGQAGAYWYSEEG